MPPAGSRAGRAPGRRTRRTALKTSRAIVVLECAAFLAGCTPQAPGPPASPPEAGAPTPPVVRRPVAAPPPAAAPEEAPVTIPPGAVYACVVGSGEQRSVTAIEFVPKVAALCARNPEMGPCQYEREVCRRSNGRVFGADGKEITKATEAEYDRKVMRLRFKAN